MYLRCSSSMARVSPYIAAQVKGTTPDATLEELRARSGMAVSLMCIHHTLRKLGFTREKSLYVRTNSADEI